MARLPPAPLSWSWLCALSACSRSSPLAGRHRGFQPFSGRTRDRAFRAVAHPRFREGRLLCGLTSCSARSCRPSLGPVSRGWDARRTVRVDGHARRATEWSTAREDSFWHANATSEVFASAVMTGSRPARGRSSSASITPSSAARLRQRLTVCCVTPEYRAKYPGAMVSLLATYVWLHGNEIALKPKKHAIHAIVVARGLPQRISSSPGPRSAFALRDYIPAQFNPVSMRSRTVLMAAIESRDPTETSGLSRRGRRSVDRGSHIGHDPG